MCHAQRTRAISKIVKIVFHSGDACVMHGPVGLALSACHDDNAPLQPPARGHSSARIDQLLVCVPSACGAQYVRNRQVGAVHTTVHEFANSGGATTARS